MKLPDKISQIFDEGTQDRINCMPATLMDEKVCGVNWVSVFPGNPHLRNTPNVSGLIILSELVNGFPFAVMDGTFITALRTACMGAIGSKYLAHYKSKVIGIIGSGEQAKMHLISIKHVHPEIELCRVASRSAESEQRFIGEIMYTTNAIESLNSSFRKVTKKGSFPSEEAVLKALYLRLTELYKKWANRPLPNWALVRNQLSMDDGMQARIMKYEKD